MRFAQNFETNLMPHTKSAQIPYTASYFFANLEVGGRALAHKLIVLGNLLGFHSITYEFLQIRVACTVTKKTHLEAIA